MFNFLTGRFQGAITRWEPGSPPELVTTTPPLGWPYIWTAVINQTGEWAAYTWPGKSRHVYLRSLVDLDLEPQLFHEHEGPISNILLHPKLDWVAVRGEGSPTITVLPVGGDQATPLAILEGRGLPWMRNDESRIVEAGLRDGIPTAYVWDLEMPAGAEPLQLRWRYLSESLNGVEMDPSGRWVAAGTIGVVPFWPLPADPTVIFPSIGGPVTDVAWTPDGRSLVVPPPAGNAGPLRVQPLAGGGRPRRLAGRGGFSSVAVDPDGRFAVAAGLGVAVFPLDGSELRVLKGIDPRAACGAVAFDPIRQRVAAGVFKGAAAQKVIGVWDLDDGTYRELGPSDSAGDVVDGGYVQLVFAPDGSLLSFDRVALRRWNVDDGTFTVPIEGLCAILGVDEKASTAMVGCLGADGQADLMSIDLVSQGVAHLEPLGSFTSMPSSFTLSPLGDAFAIGFDDGSIFVWALDGGEAYLLLGHESRVFGLEFSPDGRSLASSGQDGTVRVWQAPDLSKPPLYALPHAELLAKLDTHTNVRMVQDETSPNGWKLEIGLFPGWADLPKW